MRLLAAALALLVAVPAHADVLIDNVKGLTLDEQGEVETFNAVLIGDDGRIEQVFARKEKHPGKVDYRLDGGGRVMIPGLIDSHAHVMRLGFALLKEKAGFKGTPKGEPRPEDRDLAFAEAQQAFLEQGITTVADMGTTIADWQTYRRAGDLGRLRLRVIAYAANTADMALIGGPGPTPWLYKDRLKQNGVSITLDGPLDTREAWLKSPYADTPDVQGEPAMTMIQLRNLMSRGAIDNFQVAVTAHGDAADAAVLDALDELGETYKGDRRWRIEGAGLIDPADLPRLAGHGVIASMLPQHLAPQRGLAETRLGPQRLAGVQAWRSLTDSGAKLVFGSGAPSATIEPFSAMAAAITRQDADGQPYGGWQPQERITREDALAAYTADAAHALFAEGRLGRIAKGHRADFLFIDRDPLLTSPGELRQVRVLQTWVGGELVYDAQGDAAKSAADPFEGR